MASLVNTKSYEAQSRMVGIFAPRVRAKDSTVTSGTFAVRIPSYSEVGSEWRGRVMDAVAVLFSGMDAAQNLSRKWACGKSVHEMLMFRTPEGMQFREAMGVLVKNIPGAIEKLGLPGSEDGLAGEKFARSFERLLEDCDLAMQKPEGDKETRIIFSDLLSRMGLLFQVPFIVPEEGLRDKPLDALHNMIFSADFGKNLGNWRDLGLVQSHVFGVSPFPIRCTDMFAFKNGEKGPRGVEIKIGWDALLNARPALDALIGVLASGKAFGPGLKATAEIVKQNSGKAGYTGDPNGIRSLSGETLFVRIPDEVRKGDENGVKAFGGERIFISTLHAIVKPWLNLALSPDKLGEFLIPEDKLPAEAKAAIVRGRAAIETGGDVYAAHSAQVAAEREENARKTESGMDLTPRIVPYPGKPQLYVLFPTDKNSEAARSAISEFVAGADGMNPPRWGGNNKYKYTSAYITADRESENNTLVTLEGRIIAAKKLHAHILERTGLNIPVSMPNSLNLTLRVGGLSGKKGETFIFVEVPSASDRNIRNAAKKGDYVLSDESKFLTEVKKTLSERADNEDEEFVIDGAGEMTLMANEDSRTVFGINVTPLAAAREQLEKAVESVRKTVEAEILAPLAEKYPSVPIGIAVRYTKDERAKEREKELRQNLASWKSFESERASAEEPSAEMEGEGDFFSFDGPGF